MELVERRLPTFTDSPGNLPNYLEYRDYFPDDKFTDCDCGAPPPPNFSLPPPPAPPPVQEVSFKPLPVSGRKKFSRFTTDVEECLEEEQKTDDVCASFLISGDARIKPKMEPPLTAILLAVVTLSFIILIAFLVVIRHRRRKPHSGPKPKIDLKNGVIYEDLPSGPTPRALTAYGHDTQTLAPMELIDLKLSGRMYPKYASTESKTNKYVKQYSTPDLISSPMRGRDFSGLPINDATSLYDNTNLMSQSIQDLYNPTYEEISIGSPTSTASKTSRESSNILYQATRHTDMPQTPNEEWECLQWSSRNSMKNIEPPPPIELRKKYRTSPGSGTTDGSDYHENLIFSLLPPPPKDFANAQITDRIRPSYLYTVPCTSDGRTSTSSSSEHPPDKSSSESHYYVRNLLPQIISRTQLSTSHDRGLRILRDGTCRALEAVEPVDEEGTSFSDRNLPPLPSRTDKYRIFFTAERRKAGGIGPTGSSCTMKPSSHNRTKRLSGLSKSTDTEFPLF